MALGLVLLLTLAADAGSSSCDAARAEAAVRAASREYCASVKDGCTFEVRAPDEKGTRVVMVSLIHSRDEQGRPRFMPEGFQFADVSPQCKVLRLWGHRPSAPGP